jgi:acyl-CoA thioesterase
MTQPIQPKDIVSHDKFAKHIGAEVIDRRPGYGKVKLIVQQLHHNGAGFIHGSVLFTIADIALATAANSRDKYALLVNASMTFVKAEQSGIIFAEATEQSVSNKLATYAVRVTHEDGTLLANFQGMVYLK